MRTKENSKNNCPICHKHLSFNGSIGFCSCGYKDIPIDGWAVHGIGVVMEKSLILDENGNPYPNTDFEKLSSQINPDLS